VRTTTLSWMFTAALAAAPTAGCDEDETPSALETDPLEAPAPAPSSRRFMIDSAATKVEFLMEAPLESIHGVADRSMQGELFVDLTDLAASRGLVKIDLDGLEVFQRTRESTSDELAEETTNDTQNAHMRTWLQISEDSPAEVRDANRYVQFNITRVSDLSATNLMEMEGAERVVTATLHGDFRLHGRTTQKSARVELTFAFEGDEPRTLRARTVEPIAVGLADHAVRPRSTFDTLAEATLATLGQKVAEAAPITFELTARAGAPVDQMPTTAIEASEAAAAAADLGVEGEGATAAGE